MVAQAWPMEYVQLSRVKFVGFLLGTFMRVGTHASARVGNLAYCNALLSACRQIRNTNGGSEVTCLSGAALFPLSFLAASTR
jgi:hypothetical protein